MATCAACATTPAVIVEGYVEKGKWVEVGGLRVYVTGDETSSKAIVDIYDVFGPAPRTLQGADFLAVAVGAVVFVPDWFGEGNAMKQEWTTNPTPENTALRAAFFAKFADFGKQTKELLAFVEAAKGKWTSVESWASLGLCWGGKVVAIASAGKETPFKVSGQVHPGRLATEDAVKIEIPHIVLASNDEDARIVEEYKVELEKKEGVLEIYGTMWHGWMGARANLEKEEGKKEYERGYKQVSEFFVKHL